MAMRGMVWHGKAGRGKVRCIIILSQERGVINVNSSNVKGI